MGNLQSLSSGLCERKRTPMRKGTTMIWILIGMGVVLAGLVVWALVAIGADADKRMAEMMRQEKRNLPVIPGPPTVKRKRKIGLYLWKYKATDEYAAHQYVPEEDGLTDEDVEVIDEFEHEVEE